ncbi:MAG: hypothetical protein NC483_01410 [Ruminococcus sp.]|nr:hypothetical protein [Ruminococcus sp.]
MKKRNTILFITNLALVILSYGILLMPIFKFYDLKVILLFILGLYALMEITSFILIRKKDEFESLSMGIISLIMMIVTYFLELNDKKLLLIILIWMGVNALVKLKKVDYYHDRKNRMWILKLFLLFIFILSGLFTSINLFSNMTQLVAIGYFFLISSLLDTIEVLVKIVIGDEKCK